MQTEYKSTKIFYKIVGKKQQKTIIFLHGWGCDGTIFKNLEVLKFFYKCIFIDFPPFGKSDSPQNTWRLEDYSNIVLQIIKDLNLQNVSILAHSFGVRVAIKLAYNNDNIDKLVFSGGAGLKPRRNFFYYLKIWHYKLFKKFLKNKNVGSIDYKSLSFSMKKTFINIINEDLKMQSLGLTNKTLLIYGKKDKETPLYMAKKFNKLIKNSKLIIYPNSGHYCFLDNAENFYDDVLNFLCREV